jgi:hypothetical protein
MVGKKKPSLGDINPRDDDGVQGRKAQREVDDPHDLNPDLGRVITTPGDLSPIWG